MDKETLPRWGWLLLGLFFAAIVANVFNAAVLGQAGLSPEFEVVTVITLMSPVLIYIGVWYDEDRQHYWENSQEHIVGDVLFVLAGAALGSSIVLAAVVDLGLPTIVQEVIAMAAGFLLSWGLFWWRNPEVYQREAGL